MTRKKTIIGVDLGGTHVRAALIRDHRMVEVVSRPIRSKGTKAEVLEDLCSAIDSVLVTGGSRAAGIGIGVPSLVEPKTGIIRDTTNIPSWKKVPLRQILEKRYRIPVRVDNDANCFALGERAFGHGKNCENFAGLIIGTGLGAGIISNGRLHSGVDCGAGEFGALPYRDSVIEHYASGQFFQKFGREGAELAQAAARGEKEALAVFSEYGKHLAAVVQVILYSLAPEMIVLGGSVSKSYRHFRKPLFEALQGFAYPSVLSAVKIKVSTQKYIAVLGAGTLVHDKS